MFSTLIARRGLFLFAALAVFAGCGSEKVVPSGTVILEHSSVTAGVTRLRALGFDASSQVSFGAASVDMAASVTLPNVPVTTTALELTYFAGEKLVGIARVSVAVTTGTTTVSVPSFDQIATGVAFLTLSPADVTLAAGLSQQFTATATFEDGTSRNLSSSADWSVSDAALAEVSPTGLLTTHAQGTVTITAAIGTVSSKITITIASPAVSSLELTPAHPAFAAGKSIQLKATAHLSDGSTADLTSTATWSAPAGGSVTAGLVTSTTAGAFLIRATGGGQIGETTVNVFPSELESLTIDQGTSLAVSKGSEQVLTVKGSFSDGSTQNVTSLVTWTSSDPKLVVDASGVVSALDEGAYTVTATLAGESASIKISVIRATVVAVRITAPDAVLPSGASTQLTATAIYTDGAEDDVTATAFWLSSDPTLADVTTGLVTAASVGTVTISASFENFTGTLDLLVQDAALTSLEVTPSPTLTLQKGRTQQLTATGTFTDGSTHDLSSYVTWSSSNANASVDARGVLTGDAAGEATITAALKSFTASLTVTVEAPATAQLVATPSHTALAKGTTVSLTAEAILTDGQHSDITDLITWTSGNTAFATVTNHLVTAVAPGTTTLHGTYDGKSVDVDLVVTDATLQSLTLSPSTLITLAKGEKTQFVAQGTFSDGTTQNLSSTVMWGPNTGAVGVSESGLADARSEGAGVVTASFRGFSASTQVVVTAKAMQSLSISPTPLVLADGTTQQLQATLTWSDGSTDDVASTTTWGTSAASVVTVDATGLATGVTPGTATITAAYSGFTATASTQITEPELVSYHSDTTEATLAKGKTLQLDLIGEYTDGSNVNLSSLTTWASSLESVATVDASGRVTATGTGTAIISGTFRGFTMSKSIIVTAPVVTALSVSPATKSLPIGDSVTFTVTATYSDGTSGPITSATPYVDRGDLIAYNASLLTATGTALGDAQVRFTANGVSVFATVHVTDPVLRSLSLSSTTLSLAKGKTSALTVTGTYSDGSQKNVTSLVTWSTSASAIATVASGVVTAAGTGSATITATIGSASTTCAVTVTAATVSTVTLTPATVTLTWTKSTQLNAIATMSDGTTSNVTTFATWGSTVSTVASVTGGLVTGVKAGTSTINATYNSVQGTAAVTVNGSALELLVTPRANLAMEVGETKQLTASGTLTDGTPVDVSSAVSWTSAVTSVATVSANGLITAVGTGSTSITATAYGTTSSVTVRVKSLSSVQIVPTTLTLPTRVQYAAKAQATYTDGTRTDITSKAAWSVTNTSVATVAPDGTVLAGTSAGSTSLNITYGTKSATAPLTVTSASLQSVRIEPSNLLMAPGTTRTVRVMGTFSDASQYDLTSQATWTSDNPALGTASGSTVSALAGAAGTSATLTVVTAIAPTFANTTVTLSGGNYLWSVDNNNPAKFTQFQIDAAGGLVYLTPGNVTAVSGISATAKHPNGRFLYTSNSTGTTASQFSVGADGQLTALTPLTTGKQIHTLAADPFGRFVFMLDNAAGAIIPYTIGTDGTLTAQGTSVTTGTSPQRLIVHPSGKYLYAAVWSSAAVFQYTINADGSLTAMSPATVSATGQIQGISFDPTGNYVYVGSAGGGEVYQYRVNPDGTLSIQDQNKIALASAVRQIVLHPTKKIAYIAASSIPVIYQVRINDDGGLEDLNKAISVGTGERAGLAIDPNGQYAYIGGLSESKIYRNAMNSDGTISTTGAGVYSLTTNVNSITRSQ